MMPRTHAFLISSSVLEIVRSNKVSVRLPSYWTVTVSTCVSLFVADVPVIVNL